MTSTCYLLYGSIFQIQVARLSKFKYSIRRPTSTFRLVSLAVLILVPNTVFSRYFDFLVQNILRYWKIRIQDDDYIIHPEVFRNVHTSFLESSAIYHNPPPIMLLPSHEHLGTDLLHTSVRYSASHDSHINTTFAWLGHGTLLRRSQASAFLHLLRRVGLSEEEMNMADNYFTILSARCPVIWHADTIELRDVKAAPFTAGVEGHRRNWRHIVSPCHWQVPWLVFIPCVLIAQERAMFYLNTLLRNGSLDDISSHFWPSASEAATRIAPCMSDACTISTNILMIPPHSTVGHDWTPGINLEDIQAERLNQLGHDGASWYESHPLSNAVDGDMETAFRSIGCKSLFVSPGPTES